MNISFHSTKPIAKVSKSYFSRHDVYLIALFLHLTDIGFTRNIVSSFLKAFWTWEKLEWANPSGIDRSKPTLRDLATSVPFLAICGRLGEESSPNFSFFSKKDDLGNPCRDMKTLGSYGSVMIVNIKSLCDRVDKALG